eukprot:gene1625-1767_t
MNRAALRRFEFFDVDVVSEDIVNTLGVAPTCAVAEGGMLIFGDDNGNIIFTDRDLRVTERRSKAFKGKVRGLAYLLDPQRSNRQYVIAVGEDFRPYENAPPVYLVKVYSTTDLSRPMYVLNATAAGDATLTAFAVQHDGNEIALGYSNGKVLLYLGQFLKDNSQSRQSTIAPIVLLDRHIHAVSSLDFCDGPLTKTEDRIVRLYVTLDTKNTAMESEDELLAKVLEEDDIEGAGIIVYDTSYTLNATRSGLVLNATRDPKALDRRGSSALCSSYMRGTGELILARQEAICAYTCEDRAGALAVFGEKLCLSAAGRYALVVSIEEKTTGSTSSAAAPSSKAKRPTVTIYDLKHKLICGTFKRYYLPVNDRVYSVFHDGGVVYLLTTGGQLIRFREKDTVKKLDVLLHQIDPPLYALAITLAAEEQVEATEIMKLYQAYADHLYGKHDYEGAIQQYIHTIGYLPSSYVITRYLDPYRMQSLVLYLERLKDKSMATADHLTLLLSAYCKLKAESSISALLGYVSAQLEKLSSNSAPSSSKLGLKSFFDAPMAIKLLNQSGYTDLALRVALRCGQHLAYMDMQLARLPVQYDDILAYVAYLFLTSSSLSDTLDLLRRYSRELLAQRDKAFTQLLILACTGELFTLATALPTTSAKPQSSASSGSATLPAEVLKVLQQMLAQRTDSTRGVTSPASADLLCPSQCTMLFIDHPNLLLMFLENVTQRLAKTRIFPPKVWTTLLELHLSRASSLRQQIKSSPSSNELETEAKSHENAVLSILDGPTAQYEPAHALLMCQAHNFLAGQVYLLDKLNHIHLLLDIYLKQENTNDLFKLLRKVGNKQPEIYVQVLKYFVQPPPPTIKSSSSGESDDESAPAAREKKGDEDEQREDETRWEIVTDLLDLIEREAVLSPAQVLNILALNKTLPLRVAAQYVTSVFRDLGEGLSTVEEEANRAQQQLSAVINTVSTTKETSASSAPKRRTGYDDYDDDDDEEDDLETKRQHEEEDRNKWLNIRESHLQRAGQHEVFFRDLEHSTDGWATVAGYYGLTVISYDSK